MIKVFQLVDMTIGPAFRSGIPATAQRILTLEISLPEQTVKRVARDSDT